MVHSIQINTKTDVHLIIMLYDAVRTGQEMGSFCISCLYKIHKKMAGGGGEGGGEGGREERIQVSQQSRNI